MEHHERFVTLKMVQQVSGAIVRLDLRHFESSRDLFLDDVAREGRLQVEVMAIFLCSIPFLNGLKPVVDVLNLLLELSFISKKPQPLK